MTHTYSYTYRYPARPNINGCHHLFILGILYPGGRKERDSEVYQIQAKLRQKNITVGESDLKTLYLEEVKNTAQRIFREMYREFLDSEEEIILPPTGQVLPEPDDLEKGNFDGYI